MKSEEKAKDLVLRAMQHCDSTIKNIEYEQSITGYFGFDQMDIADYIYYIEKEIGIEITDSDIQNRMSSTTGETIKFLTELTLENDENN